MGLGTAFAVGRAPQTCGEIHGRCACPPFRKDTA
jgi:hypothetical protein